MNLPNDPCSWPPVFHVHSRADSHVDAHTSLVLAAPCASARAVPRDGGDAVVTGSDLVAGSHQVSLKPMKDILAQYCVAGVVPRCRFHFQYVYSPSTDME